MGNLHKLFPIFWGVWGVKQNRIVQINSENEERIEFKLGMLISSNMSGPVGLNEESVRKPTNAFSKSPATV